MFIAFDGIDGTGKSTQIRLFLDWLDSQQRAYVTFRDPGTTRLGEALREILLQRTEIRIEPLAEAMIYMASRAALVTEVIQPAIHHGKDVIGDRYVLANVAYQGYGLGLGRDLLWKLGQIATQGIMPELTILLDLDVDLAATRRGTEADRLEGRERSFHEKVREGFLREAKLNPDKIAIVSAAGPAEEIHQHIRALVLEKGLWDRS